MILVHRLKGESMFLNSDLVEYIETTPDTVVTLVDGRRIVLQDDPEELIDRVVRFRAAVLVVAEESRNGEAMILEYPRLVEPVEPEGDDDQ